MAAEFKRISKASVFRMELYLEYLEQMLREGMKYVTSDKMGKALGIASVSVRQDLFALGSEGKPKVGYEISRLLELLHRTFDLDRKKQACVVGCGNLGRALAGSQIWDRAGYELAAIFDNDPGVIGTEVNGIRVRNISEIFGVIKTCRIEMAVIAVPAVSAQEIANLLAAAEVKGIWNFAPTVLNTPEDVVVENQSLVWGLIALSYAMKEKSNNKVIQ